MKMKLAFATATALGLLMGNAMADSNKTASEQDGNDNSLLVRQDGKSNTAGNSLTTNNRLYQFGDNNSITVRQKGDSNNVGNDGSADWRGLHQTGVKPDWQPLKRGDGNVIVIDQTSGAVTGTANGNKVASIRQSSGTGGSATTNSAIITQDLGGAGDRAAHYVGRVVQEHTTGVANTLVVTQTGAHSRTAGGNAQSNRIGGYDDNGYQDWFGGIKQKGSGNSLTVTQEDLAERRVATRGPGNVIFLLDQDGTTLSATVTQNGFQNYVKKIEQTGSGNTATVSLTGTGNGAVLPTGIWAMDNLPKVGVLSGAAGEAAAAYASSVVQKNGSGNAVSYEVLNADGNQFGFYQNGSGNQAVSISISGDANQLGVSQEGTNNTLALTNITGSENIIGLKQDGTSNLATINVFGDQNVGYSNFNSSKIASGLGLTAGLLEQYGTSNEVTLTVNGGSGNVFASRQGALVSSSLPWGSNNKIDATQTGSDNEAAVLQAGSSNLALVSQNGSGNSVSISQ